MVPKEKAKELFDKMLNTDGMDMTRFCSKQCALITVDEIFQFLDYDSDIEYWQQVKTEIKKL